MTGAETARFPSGYGIAPFPDYGVANMQPYAPNRGLRQQNNLGGGANIQGFNAGGLGRGRGVGNLQGNFKNGGFLSKGKNIDIMFIVNMCHSIRLYQKNICTDVSVRPR